MVRVNGNKFKIYELDTLYTFKNRLARDMNTIVSFLYFPEEVTEQDIHSKKNILVEDFFTEVKNSAKQNSSVVQLVNNILGKAGKTKFDKGKIIVKLWLAYNKKLKKDVKQQGKTPLYEIGDQLYKNNTYISINQIHTDWGSVDQTKKYYEDKIELNKEKVDDTLQLFKEYTDIDESAPYTEFEITHIKFKLTLNLKGLSLMEMFNYIKLNSSVPFATTNKFYKIVTDFIPPEDWTKSNPTSLILQVYQKNYISITTHPSNFETSLMEIDPETDHITTKININPHKNNVSRDEFINRTLSVFPDLDIKINKIIESDVKGIFYYPTLRLDKYIFGDLVLNNDLFSRLITLDEHEKATKKKPGVHIHFEHPRTGYITATITGRIMIKGDQTMKNVDLDFFPPGEPFIRVKVSKSNSQKSIEIFQEIMGKLFQLYEQKKYPIIQYYSNYIPDFGIIIAPEEEEEKNIKHSEIAPSLYVPGYSTWCNHERMPTIISEEEAAKYKSEGKSVLKFPRDIPEDPNAFRFPMDGENQQYYACNNPIYSHPGIIRNKLKNSDIFPYVPCCFEKPQEKKPKYLNYYEGKELSVGEKKQHNIIQTNKILKNDQFGTLPPNIENLFTIIDPNPMFEYVRKGVYSSKNSFINVVMEALNDETNILNISDENKREHVLMKKRLEFANKNTAPLCRQELYDRNIKQIISLIKDEDIYFDPKLFIHLLEDHFDCNIYLFTKKVMDGELTLPRHVQAYYKNRNKRRSIYVYEHMGSESDRAKHPQCELIVKYNTRKSSNNVQYSFTHAESRNIRNVYTRLRKAYALNDVINESYLPINSSIQIYSQWIDSYGKTRRLNIKYKKQKISLIISPIQPIKVRETDNPNIFPTDIDTAMSLIGSLKITLDSQTVLEDSTKELNGVLGNVKISIPIKDSHVIDGIPIQKHGLSYPEKHASSIGKYNNNKKIARYLVEYVLWVYSSYLHENGIVDVTDDNIAQFAKKYFSIKPSYDYEHIEKTFSKSSPILDKDGKIIVHNEETVKRLVYVLRLSVQRNVDSIRNYHQHTVIQNYYVDITDFDTYKGQIILFGEESVEKWVTENNIVYTMHDSVQVGINTPYFFKNTLIDNNVYLAQNAQTLGKASDIAVTWVRKGYNIGTYAEDVTPISFTMYPYVNSSTIKQGVKIKGKVFSEEIKILGYKIDNNPEYTVLLPIV